MQQFYTADLTIGVLTLAAAILGAFGGFSGAMAFLAATVVGGLAGRVAWDQCEVFFSGRWSRGLCVLVVSLLVFGIIRWCVKRIVNGLLHQPADAIFGFLVSAAAGLGLSVLVAHLVLLTGYVSFPSVLVDWMRALFLS